MQQIENQRLQERYEALQLETKALRENVTMLNNRFDNEKRRSELTKSAADDHRQKELNSLREQGSVLEKYIETLEKQRAKRKGAS